MANQQELLRDTHTLGKDTCVLAVRADDSDDREWLAQSPMCIGLSDHHIAHCGVMQAMRPFEVVRLHLSGTFFLACFGGEGQVLVDGKWRAVVAGQACIQPPFIPNALRATQQQPWEFCWIRYQKHQAANEMASIHVPAVGNFDARPLRHAIEGMHAEASGVASFPQAPTRQRFLVSLRT